MNVERLAVGIALGALGVGAIVGGFDYGVVRESGGIGPGAVPVVVGLILAVEGIMLSLAARTRPSPETPRPDDASSGDEPSAGEGERESLTAPLLLVVMLAAALLLTPYVGFVGIIAIFAFTAARVFERLSLRTSLGLGLVAGGFIWIVFIWLLDVRLPVLPSFL